MENGLRQNYLIAVTIGAIASKNRSPSEILEETRKDAAAIADAAVNRQITWLTFCVYSDQLSLSFTGGDISIYRQPYNNGCC